MKPLSWLWTTLLVLSVSMPLCLLLSRSGGRMKDAVILIICFAGPVLLINLIGAMFWNNAGGGSGDDE